MNDPGQTFNTVVHGLVLGKQLLVGPIGVASSEAFVNNGGKFVKIDGSGHMTQAGDGDTTIAGWADVQALTANATAGVTKLNMDVSTESIYRIPVESGETVTTALRGQKCDIVISGGVQYANTSESAEGTLCIVDVDTANNCVLVKMNPVYLCQA